MLFAFATYRNREGDAAKTAARRLFIFSIAYLFALFSLWSSSAFFI